MRVGSDSTNQGRSSPVERNSCCRGCVVHLWELTAGWLLSSPLD